MTTLLPEIKPVNENDQLALFFNRYMDGLSTINMMSHPRESMSEYIYGSTDDLRREARTYQVLLLGRCLRDLHWCAHQAWDVLDNAFRGHGGDLKAFAIAQRVEDLMAMGSDDDSDWVAGGIDEAGETIWKVVHKEDEASLAPHTLQATLSPYFVGSEDRGEKIGSSEADAYIFFTSLVRTQSEFSFRKMWAGFSGEQVTECRIAEDGQAVPLTLADQIESELNEDIKNGAIADAFEQLLYGFKCINQVYQLAYTADSYRTIYVSLTALLFGPDSVADLPIPE